MYLDAPQEVITELEMEGIDVIYPEELGAFDPTSVEGEPDNGEE